MPNPIVLTQIDSLSTKVDSLSQHIQKLEIVKLKFDSLLAQNNITELKYQVYDRMQIIKDVQTFYDSAWMKLIFVITLGAVIIPFALNYFIQRRQDKSFKELIEAQNKEFDVKLQSELDMLKKNYDDIFGSFKTQFEEQICTNNKVFENLKNENESNLFYLQGQSNLNKNGFEQATKDFLHSINYLIKSDQSVINIGRINVLLSLINISIKHLNKTQFEELCAGLNIDWRIFSQKFYTNDNRDTFRSEIEKLELTISKLAIT